MTHTLKQSWLLDETTGAIYADTLESKPSKMWNEEIGGGIICVRNYHKKLYNTHRLSDLGLSDGDLLKTYKLTEYVVRNTNIIGRKRGKGYGTPADIADILSITEKKAREYLSRAIKGRALGKLTIESGPSRVEVYAFNPLYVNSCKYVPALLYNEFWEDIDKVIPEWMQDSYLRAMKDRKIESKKLNGNEQPEPISHN